MSTELKLRCYVPLRSRHTADETSVDTTFNQNSVVAVLLREGVNVN